MTGSREGGYPVIVTASVVYRDGTVLIAKRTAGALEGLWEFPGGKLEPGESPEECLARELREELGLDVEVGDIFQVVYHVYEDGPVLLLAYRCRLIGTSPSGQAENPPSRWVRISDLPQYRFTPADLPVVAKLLKT